MYAPDFEAQINSVGYWRKLAFKAEHQRDHWRYTFAGMAMQGLLSDSNLKATTEDIAACSIQIADALLGALEKEKGK